MYLGKSGTLIIAGCTKRSTIVEAAEVAGAFQSNTNGTQEDAQIAQNPHFGSRMLH